MTPGPLEFFRFRAAVGGHANDGDVYLAWLVHDRPSARDRIVEVLGFDGDGRLWVGEDMVVVEERDGRFELSVTDNRIEVGEVFLSYDARLPAWERAKRVEAALSPLRPFFRAPEGPRIRDGERPTDWR